jgi:serine/threonine protein kinase/tetratricopeptide (TPR) repeat protein
MLDDEEIEAGLANIRIGGPQYEHQIQSARARLFGEAPPEQWVAGRFLLGKELGRGGMGTVHEAYDSKLDRQVAIKLVGGRLLPEHDERLRREAQALAKLSHPNVVHIYDADTVDGQTFIAMELVQGETLDRWQRAPRTWQECLDVYLQAGRGLAAAHEAELVHRDFKPANCIIDAEGHVRVLDFGLAGTLRTDDDPPAVTQGSGVRISDHTDPGTGSSDAAALSISRTAPERLTKAGAVLGTRAYMAPEQLHPRKADARSDQFGFCVALYEALYGQLPFSDDPCPILLDMAHGATHRPLPPPRDRAAPRWLHRIVVRGLSARSDARWPSMTELLGEIARRQRRAKQRRLFVTVGGLVCVALASLVSVLQRATLPCEQAQHGLHGIWDPAQQQRVGDAILATGHPGAPHTWTIVRREIDHYADDWTHASMQACEATLVHHDQSVDVLERRQRCLTRRRSALRDRVELLASNPRLVDDAVVLVTRLPRIEPCSDVEALAREAGAPSPEMELRASTLQEALERIRALDLIGRHDEGLEAIAPLLEEARALAHPPVLAETLQLAGQLEVSVGNHDEAEVLLREARASGLPYEPAIRATAGLVHIIGVERARPEAALELGLVAEELAQSPGLDPSLRADVLTAMAQVQTQRGDHFEARRLYSTAIELLEAQVGENHIALVEALDGQATAAHEQGQREAAERSSRRALEIREHWLGESHPAVAYQLANLAAVLVKDRSRHVETLDLCLRAARILDDAATPNPKRIAHAYVNLGAILSKMGRQTEAEEQLRRAIDAWRKAGQATHPRMAKAYFNLARVLHEQGRVSEAIESYRLVQQILESNEPTPELDDLEANARARIDRLLLERSDDGTPSAIAR